MKRAATAGMVCVLCSAPGLALAQSASAGSASPNQTLVIAAACD